MPPPRMKLDVFGRRMLAERTPSGWQLFDLGADGKRSLAKDIVIPDAIAETELAQYLADICHEAATKRHPAVRRLTE